MQVIRARNVHEALARGFHLLKEKGVARDSRNGPVLMFSEPVTTVYERPEERVLFYPERDANPFFHLFEALWMLSGRNDVEYLQKMVGRFAEYSDDGVTLHGAYGYRWRRHFGIDQLAFIAARLRADPDDRRCVLQMWDARIDLRDAGTSAKDLPCNTQVYFAISSTGQLDMTVCNRSNDLVWGAYGANAVHFSVLQEYLAAKIGVPMGRYYQVSNNLHAYKVVLEKLHLPHLIDNPYVNGGIHALPMFDGSTGFDWDLESFLCDDWDHTYEHPFFTEVAVPMRKAYLTFKDESKDKIARIVEAQDLLFEVKAEDWFKAGDEWLHRRLEKATAEVDAQ